jgi:photosystem I P700 chlorophyll a apoprotein A1
MQTKSLEDISRKIFSAHFGQLAIIFLWISGMVLISLTIQLG